MRYGYVEQKAVKRRRNDTVQMSILKITFSELFPVINF